MTATFAVLAALGAAPAMAQNSADVANGIVRSGSRPLVAGPASYFTGSATVRPMVDAELPGHVTTGSVTFAPGARSNWHHHPAGQTLVVTEGCGWTQREGGPVMRFCEGDAAFVPAGVRHWHGATMDTAMTHLSISESVDGRNVEWQEPVTDAQYRAGLDAAK